MRILPKKRSQAGLLAAFPISADVKGIDVFSAQRAKTKVSFGTFQCDRGPTETSPLFFSSSLFSLRHTCAHVVAQIRTVPKRSEAVLALEGGMMKGAERAFFLLIIPLFVEEEEATCVEESTCLLSFFEFPFVACLPLFVVLTLRSDNSDDSIFLLLPCLAVACPCVYFRKRILIGGACGVLHRGGRQRGTIRKPNTEPNTKT
jgi:hypothetical protein